MNGLKAVQALGHENEVWMQSGDLFQARIDRATNFGFFLGIGRVVAIVGVADEAILEAESVDGFRQAWSEGNDATDRLRNTNGAAGFINNFSEKRNGGGSGRGSGLCAQMRGRGQQGSGHDADCGSEARTCNFFQEIPRQRKFRGINKKAPRDAQGLCGGAPSREERGPLRHERVAWLTAFQPITVAGPRPIRTTFPATHACKLKFECMPRLQECQCVAEKFG